MSAIWISGCSGPSSGSPEAAFEGLVEAIEATDAERLDRILTEDFAGEADRNTTMALAGQWFSRKPKIRLTILDQKKESSDQGQTFRTKVLITSGGGLIPERSARIRLATQWKLVDGVWMLRVAQWDRDR